ncbi:MAG TPA: hypothetical protein VI215_08565 [Bacteroidota bacterium]|jgi:hypothetical protein
MPDAPHITLILAGLILLWFSPGVAFAQADSANEPDAAPGLFQANLSGDQPGSEDDSLQLKLLDIESRRFRRQSDHTTLWHRLIPSVRFSASFGWKDVIFLDPATLATSLLPKDAYRITIGISLDDILDDSKHAEAEMMLNKIGIETRHIRIRREKSRSGLSERLEKVRIELESLCAEAAVVEDEVRFNEMRFRQGKLDYDGVLKSKLRLIELNSRLQLLMLEERMLGRQLSHDVPQ